MKKVSFLLGIILAFNVFHTALAQEEIYQDQNDTQSQTINDDNQEKIDFIHRKNTIKPLIGKKIRVLNNWNIVDYYSKKPNYILTSEPIQVVDINSNKDFIGIYKGKKYLFPIEIVVDYDYLAENFVYYKEYNWSKSVWNSIKNQQVFIGMTKDMAILSWGKPDEINKDIGSWGVHEQWVYNVGDYRNNYLYFKNGRLSSIQN